MRSVPKTITILFSCISLATTTLLMAEVNKQQGWLINNVIIVDGSGAKGFSGAVRVRGNVITGVGDLVPGDG